MSTSSRPAPSVARTVTQEDNETRAGPSTTQPTEPPSGVLKLRGGPLKQQRVVWSEETVDNEGMGKKKSKICCIYHKPRAFDESSDESSCSSDDDDNRVDPSQRSKGRKSDLNGQGHAHRSRRLEGGAEEEASDSSDSEGGAGDGRARPARRSKKHEHNQPHDCNHRKGKMNRYDVQPKAEGGADKGKPIV